jgi:hypothetical protein
MTWKWNHQGSEWEDIPKELLFHCDTEECFPDFYNSFCNQSCETISENQICLDRKKGNGEIRCEVGKFGNNCKSFCLNDWDCSNNGTCFEGHCYC